MNKKFLCHFWSKGGSFSFRERKIINSQPTYRSLYQRIKIVFLYESHTIFYMIHINYIKINRKNCWYRNIHTAITSTMMMREQCPYHHCCTKATVHFPQERRVVRHSVCDDCVCGNFSASLLNSSFFCMQKRITGYY